MPHEPERAVGRPGLSVVMPVLNGMPHLDAAVESVLSQSGADFELVICDDGSSDGSLAAAMRWAERDPRIRVLARQASKGPASSSNWAVCSARAELVARHDADDISLPGRLAAQRAYLDAHDDVVMVGSLWTGIDSSGGTVREADLAALGDQRVFQAPFAHGSVMFRRSAFDLAGGYRSGCDFWEDIDLFCRMSRLGRIAVLKMPYYRHRFSPVSSRLTGDARRIELALDLRLRASAAWFANGDYEEVLSEPFEPSRRVSLECFRQIAGLHVWGGTRHRLWRRILSAASPGPLHRAVPQLVFLLWASMSPKSLRGALRLRLGWLNQRHQCRDEVVFWSPGPARSGK